MQKTYLTETFKKLGTEKISLNLVKALTKTPQLTSSLMVKD